MVLVEALPPATAGHERFAAAVLRVVLRRGCRFRVLRLALVERLGLRPAPRIAAASAALQVLMPD